MRIMIATDTHLGFDEKDPIRGADSFIVFEEILQMAKNKNADFMIFGGDLFHENKPSRQTLHKTIELLRKYCMGDRAVGVRMVSDPSLSFTGPFPRANYEDPNFNVEMPIFAIHGNHDDPSGGGYSGLDLLSVSGYINYFGKTNRIDDIVMYPLLFEKGETKVAIYGLGNIRDERLRRTFEAKHVKLIRPAEQEDKWFTVMMIHQNRFPRAARNFIPEKFLDDFLDFVVWGHEHESMITPEQSADAQFFVCQPGSSVAVSLTEGEAKKKHVGLLHINGDKFRLEPIPLVNVRPFIYDTIKLSEQEDLPKEPEAVTRCLTAKVNQMVELAQTNASPALDPRLRLPLIRLQVDHTDYPTVGGGRFGQAYVNHVANPSDILIWKKKAIPRSTAMATAMDMDPEAILNRSRDRGTDDGTDVSGEGAARLGVDNLLLEILETDGLRIIPHNDLLHATQAFVSKNESNAFVECIENILKMQQTHLAKTISVVPDPEEIVEMIRSYAKQTSISSAAFKPGEAEAKADEPDDADHILKMLSNSEWVDNMKNEVEARPDDDNEGDEDSEDAVAPSKKKGPAIPKQTKQPVQKRRRTAAPKTATKAPKKKAAEKTTTKKSTKKTAAAPPPLDVRPNVPPPSQLLSQSPAPSQSTQSSSRRTLPPLYTKSAAKPPTQSTTTTTTTSSSQLPHSQAPTPSPFASYPSRPPSQMSSATPDSQSTDDFIKTTLGKWAKPKKKTGML
ncbi:DNA repair exonuclease [Pelomyxa schiedti]|nr:DNA repair exonuclease [Pelomyxa schiedti]